MRRDQHRGAVIRRRLRTIPIVYLMFVAWTILLPVLLVVGFVVDVVRRLASGIPFVLLRGLLFGWAYLALESVLIPILAVMWLVAGFGRSRRIIEGSAYKLQSLWAGSLMSVAKALFRLRFEIEGDEVVRPGPVIVMIRHASIVDVLLPNVLVTRRNGVRLNYVLKRELLVDPAIDIAGNRLPNHFVHRGGDSASEIAAIEALSAGLDEHSGVVIYPEGTRFTAGKRERAIAHLERTRPELARRAAGLRHVLPPRLGGPVALLDPVTPADVVVIAHVGLDGFAAVKDVLRGAMVGATVRVCFRRFPREEIPETLDGRVEWLFDRWSEIDDWIDRELSAG